MCADAQGGYGFTSIKPAPYPDRTMPAHIHLMGLAPGGPPHRIHDTVFEAEFRVDAGYRAKKGVRGDGVAALKRCGPLWTGVRVIRLERHPA
jgi:protocatechuate 3,4-dioxygenase beta subunit